METAVQLSLSFGGEEALHHPVKRFFFMIAN